MGIGEAGTVTTGSPTANAPINVTFTQPITDPVVALTSTQNGSDPFSLRVTGFSYNIAGDATGFTFIIEEWEYLDGPHPAVETINWLAIKEGVNVLPDGRIIEAGTTQANTTDTAVTLNGGFGSPPVVLTSVMSNNDAVTVDSDPLDITASGFNVRLQEEEGQDNIHALETVGYIAIQPGGNATAGTAGTPGNINDGNGIYGLGATFTNPIVLGETQTINGPDTATVAINGGTGSTTNMSLNEEQSNDTETGHTNEVIGIVAFENGIVLCFTPGTMISTRHGPKDVADLVPGDLILTKDNGPQPLHWTSRKHLGAADLAAHPDYLPVLIRKDSIGPGLPAQDMHVSPQHRMLIEGWKAELYTGQREVLVPAKSLTNDHGILTDTTCTSVEYIHLLFDAHQVIFANGTPTESLHAGDVMKSAIPDPAREELFALFPDLRWSDGTYGQTARPVLNVRDARIFA